MKKAIAVFTGDNHLRPTTWLKHPTLEGDTYESWRQITDACEKLNLPLILLGDLFDSGRPDSRSVGVYLQGVSYLASKRLPVYYIEGNHEQAAKPWASLSYHATLADGSFVLNGIEFCGISFTPAANLAAKLAAIPPTTRVLLSHQSWLEIQRVGHVDGSFSQIPHGLTMLTGDYHVCGPYTGVAANGEPVVAYSPGSTALQAINESPSKYFGVLYDDLTVEWRQLETRPVISTMCDTPESLDYLLQQMQANEFSQPVQRRPVIQKPILRVRYLDTLPEAYSRLTAAAGDRYHLFLEPQHQTATQVVDMEAASPTAFDNLSSALQEICPPGSGQAMASQRLLGAADVQAELAAMFTEFTTQAAVGTAE